MASKYLLIVELVSDGRGVTRQPADEEVGLEVDLWEVGDAFVPLATLLADADACAAATS